MRLMVSGLLTVASGVVTVLMAGNPLHLRHFAPIFVVLVGVTTVSATVTALLLPARRVVRRAVAGACAAIGFAVTAILGFGAVAFHSPGQAAMRVVSSDGRYALVSVQGRAFVAIDPQYDVLLVTGSGLFARESVVWRGAEEGAAPRSMRFVGPDEIELTTDDGCRYRSQFDRVSMAVRPVWTAHSVTGCASPG